MSKTLQLILVFVTSLFLSSCQNNSPEDRFLTGQGLGIYSATLVVEDIESAIDYYRDTLGFSIRGNGRPGVIEGSISASSSMPDMSLFIIMSDYDTLNDEDISPTLNSYLKNGEGIRTFSISSSFVDSTFSSLTTQGFEMDSIQSYRTTQSQAAGWSRDSGDPQRMSLDFDADNPPADLPRFIQNTNTNYEDMARMYTSYYVYGRMFSNHANGVVGISAIKLITADIDEMSATYDKIGFERSESKENHVSYSIYGNQELHLISASNDEKLSKFVEEKGDGVYAIQFDVENLDSTYHFFKEELPEEAIEKQNDRIIIDSEYAFGVQLEFIQEPYDQGVLARKLSVKEELDPLAIEHAGELYTKYCALCHGENREGYAADHAPSLQSKSLLATSKNNNFMRYTIQFGRANTAMAGYLDSQGGPLEYIEIELLLQWLYNMAEVEEPLDLSREPVLGNIASGEKLYSENCTVCHGEKGEGVTAPALANPMLLATATDHFLRYAIAEGRDGTPMVAFKEQLSDDQIDDLTAFLRTRASGWDIPQLDTVRVPTPEEYVLNPESEAPEFNLRAGRYVSADQVYKALEEGKRMVILDARSEVAWRQMHIPGSAPVPYYEEPENFIDDIPNDGTQIVIYCACPHAASERVQNTLKRYGYENTAIIDEGILVWAQMGFPVRNGS